MKTSLLTIAFFMLCSLVNAQDVPNQNPNYKQSMDYYMKHKDELIKSMNITPQETYKAFDWYQNKLDRRQARRDNRFQIRLARASSPTFFRYQNPRFRNYRNFNNWDDCNNSWFWF
ncbi:MAG: hypothetical protein ACOVO1_06935 [Chitinophagaceae bacterium]